MVDFLCIPVACLLLYGWQVSVNKLLRFTVQSTLSCMAMLSTCLCAMGFVSGAYLNLV